MSDVEVALNGPAVEEGGNNHNRRFCSCKVIFCCSMLWIGLFVSLIPIFSLIPTFIDNSHAQNLSDANVTNEVGM